MSARSARQAAMQNAGLSVGDASVRSVPQQRRVMGGGPRQAPTRQVRDGRGSEARLGDILVDLIRRVEGIETHIRGLGSRITEGEQETRAWLEGRMGQLESALWTRMDTMCGDVRSAWREPNYDMRSGYSAQTVEVQCDPRQPQSMDRAWTASMYDAHRPGSCSSVGTNEFGYDDEYVSDCASPTPSELADCQSAFVEGEVVDDEVANCEEPQVVVSEADNVQASTPAIGQAVPGWEYAGEAALETNTNTPMIAVTTQGGADKIQTNIVPGNVVTLSVEAVGAMAISDV